MSIPTPIKVPTAFEAELRAVSVNAPYLSGGDTGLRFLYPFRGTLCLAGTPSSLLVVISIMAESIGPAPNAVARTTCFPNKAETFSVYSLLERIVGIEPTSGAWKALILAVELYPHLVRME